jgi:hypothetical protein
MIYSWFWFVFFRKDLIPDGFGKKVCMSCAVSRIKMLVRKFPRSVLFGLACFFTGANLEFLLKPNGLLSCGKLL